MATNRLLFWAGLSVLPGLLCAAAALGREAATQAECSAAISQPAIANPKAVVEQEPADLRASFRLADAWSDLGCFNEAVQVLQRIETLQPEDKELKTRLRVARSLVGEEHFFDNLDRADAAARLKRDAFRCNSLGDIAACDDAVKMQPDNAELLTAQGDALAKADRPADALTAYKRAQSHSANSRDLASKVGATEALVAAQGKARTAPLEANRLASAPPAPSALKSASRLRVASNAAVAPAGLPARAPVTAAASVPAASAQPIRKAESPAPLLARQYSNNAPESQSH